MKGAMILSRNSKFFLDFKEIIEKNFESHFSSEKSVKILSESGDYLVVYDRSEGEDIFEEYDIPMEAKSNGYVYAFLSECRSEVMFCNILSSTCLNLDMLICDGDGMLYRPSELSPERIVL